MEGPASPLVRESVRLGVFLPQAASMQDVEQAQHAEALGLDSVWFGDTFRAPDGLDGMTLATAVLQATTRIEVGVNVLNMSIRPAQLVARAAATIEALHPGRFVLGVGSGYAGFVPLEVPWGFPPRTPEERDELFRETVEYLDRYFKNEVVTYPGKHVNIDGARGSPFLGRAPALLLGSGRRSQMRLAARYADRWDGVALWGPQHESDPHAYLVRKRNEFIHICNEVGRDPAEVTICQAIYAAIGPTRAAAEAIAAEARSTFVMPGPTALVGTPDDLAGFLTRSVDLGIRDFQVIPVSKYLTSQGAAPHFWHIEALAREVAPALRAAASSNQPIAGSAG
jgi:alkanesulfonate monooxygenase SsuD/methylene tetrahydromethanopterin reductase-like flavin-dependent oxidoreductase (luciferase family)